MTQSAFYGRFKEKDFSYHQCDFDRKYIAKPKGPSPKDLRLTLLSKFTVWAAQPAVWAVQPTVWAAQPAVWAAQPAVWAMQPAVWYV